MDTLRKKISIDHLTLSIGVSDNSGGDIVSFSQLFNNADKQLYEAKHNERNTIAG